MKFKFTMGLILLFAYATAGAQDYMDAELRNAVEALKSDVAQARSTNVTARTRARVLWNWANAYAMTGRFIPVNVTSTVNSVLGLLPEENVPPGQRRTLDNFIREFIVMDERPDALGPLTLDRTGPFIARTYETLKVTYTVGEMEMQEGGAVLVGHHFFSDSGRPQVSDPSGDNYISIRSSNTRARFEFEGIPLQGMHGGFRGAAPQVGFRLRGTKLSQGDTFTIVYGDRTHGSNGMKVQSYSSDAAPLPVYISFEEDGMFFSRPIPTYVVLGEAIHAVKGFAPSVAAVGEKIDVTVRAEDLNYNRATGDIPALSVFANGDAHSTLPAGDSPIQIISNVSFDTPGVYRFTFRSEEGTVTGSSNPIWVQEDPDNRIFWGETHGHSGFAEGAGSPDGYFTFGRDDAKLDFLTLSEHDIWMDDYEWKVMNDAVDRFTVEGEYIVFAGYEWTSRRGRGGHHNVFFRGSHYKRVPVQDAPRLTDLFLGLHALYAPEDVLVIPHAHQAGDWRNSDVKLSRLVEIMSMHGTFEWFGDRYLEFGHQVGFISASDDHLGHPGYSSGTGLRVRQRGGLAGVYSPELTTDAVFDGLRDRNAYATSGPRIILDATLNGHRMGVRQPFDEKRVIKGRVMGTAGIDTVELIKNGDTIETLIFANRDPQGHGFVQLAFESESTAIGRENPRGYRPWIGSIEVTGAKLVNVSSPGFQFKRSEWIRVDEDNKNKLHFRTETRGRINNLLLELEDIKADTSFHVLLEEGLENGTAPIRVRPFQQIPSADLNFSVGDFNEGSATHEFQVGRHKDNLTLRFIDAEAPLDQEFTFTDSNDPLRGDYYYLRVRQLDGAQAWSSPYWVGGETPR